MLGSDALNANSLYQHYLRFIYDHQTLERIHSKHNLEHVLKLNCAGLERTPVLFQLLTILYGRSQIDFERALFCSWFALLMSRLLNRPVNCQLALFYAGLLQDLGKHALDPIVISPLTERKNSLPIREGATQNKEQDIELLHPLITSTYLRDQPTIPELSADLVLHHHARDDGSGFPLHVTENQLNIDEQIIITVNEISDLLDHLGGHNQLTSALPYFQVNAALYFRTVYGQVCRLVGELAAQDGMQINHNGKELLGVKSRSRTLVNLLPQMLHLSAILVTHEHDFSVRRLRSTIHKFWYVMVDTGLMMTIESDEMKGISVDRLEQIDINELDMINRALKFLMDTCRELIDDILKQNQFSDLYSRLVPVNQSIKDCLFRMEDRPFSLFQSGF